ncbi:MAG TPA: alpha-L-arabinofuranosidase, partial [Phnomibacter sp.]|nr:alpha-L-arabinofuranosidase [Phnomibacter sp.]
MKGRKGRFGAGWFEGLLMAAIAVSSGLQAQHNTSLLVQADSILAPVQPTMWGIFFEDINMGADGGMYAELVKNRSFEFSKPLMGWQIQPAQPEGTVIVLNRVNDAVNPRYLRLQLGQQQAKSVILVNEGFRGMGIKAGEKYQFSCMVKTDAANARAEVRLVDSNGAVLAQASAVLPAASVPWQKIGASLLASSTQAKARMQLVITGTGTVDLDMISLFPQNTWKQRPGGLRQDMVQVLADMKPGFLRFPGGCIVEGFNLDQRYQWKHTIGPVEQRPLLINRWNFEFAHRPAPDYFQTFGLGFFEYFQMAEDIGAEPLPIINCGMACQFNTAELVPL